MLLGCCPELLHTHYSTEVTFARFSAERLDSSNTEALGRQLTELATDSGRRQLRLDLTAVRYISSEPLGKLVALHRQVWAAGGRLVLENVQPRVHEVLVVTRLTRLLDVRPVESWGGETCPLPRSP